MLAFHPYADLFPLIEGAAFAELVADIKANDLRERIDLLDGLVLDGRNRYLAALAADLVEADDGADRIRYFRRFVPAVDGDPLKYVISKNLQRRHLDDRQRTSVAGKIANLSQGGDRSKPPIGGMTVEQAAGTLNVAPRQVVRARVVHGRGIQELRGALDRGEVAVSVAEKIARLPQQEQPAAVAKALPNGARAIMSARQEPDDSLDYFPTPPWATRALIELVLPEVGIVGRDLKSAWEPACGEGHIAGVLKEYMQAVYATDIFDYGSEYQDRLCDFLSGEYAPHVKPGKYDWIVTNPPFDDAALQFVLKSLALAKIGVAMFVRLQWIEGVERYEKLFKPHPPTMFAPFVERVNLCKGRWDPDGGTATAYCWLVWIKNAMPFPPFWIPPGCRKGLTLSTDRARFAAWSIPPRDPVAGNVVEAI